VPHLVLSHALIGAISATALWEITRHVLVWYFATLSQIGKVYGALTTPIVAHLSLAVPHRALLTADQLVAKRISHGAPRKLAASRYPTRREVSP